MEEHHKHHHGHNHGAKPKEKKGGIYQFLDPVWEAF